MLIDNVTHQRETLSERRIRLPLRLPMSALATVARKSFNGKLTAKNDFPTGHFIFTIADADIESLKSLHILFGKYLDHMLVKFEQNCIVRNIQSFVFLPKKKIKNF